MGMTERDALLLQDLDAERHGFRLCLREVVEPALELSGRDDLDHLKNKMRSAEYSVNLMSACPGAGTGAAYANRVLRIGSSEVGAMPRCLSCVFDALHRHGPAAGERPDRDLPVSRDGPSAQPRCIWSQSSPDGAATTGACGATAWPSSARGGLINDP